MISARTWNRLVDRLARWWPKGYLPAAALGWLHPWWTAVEWDADGETWRAHIRPGFVNGIDVTVSIRDAETDEMKDIPLTDFPALPLSDFRTVGTDAVNIDGGGEAVPEFFRVRGVGDAVSYSTEGDGGIIQEITGLLDDLAEQRLLRACDVVLQHDRLAAATEWQITPAETGAQAQFSVVYRRAPNARKGGYIRTTARHSPIGPVADLTRLQGGWQDQSFDALHLSTIWLLSPPGAPLESTPDETWEPFVQHRLFWNASYVTTQPALGAVRQNLQVNLAGLGGVAGAQITVNQILSSQNDAANNALEFLTKNTISGRFTSPGHRVAPDWDKAESLDPPFPFFGLGA